MIPRRTQRARERYYASQAQQQYLRWLLGQCFSKLIKHPFNLDANHLERTTREYAAAAIDGLKAALADHRAKDCAAAVQRVDRD